MSHANFKRGDLVFERGEVGDEFFIILEGKAEALAKTDDDEHEKVCPTSLRLKRACHADFMLVLKRASWNLGRSLVSVAQDRSLASSHFSQSKPGSQASALGRL